MCLFVVVVFFIYMYDQFSKSCLKQYELHVQKTRDGIITTTKDVVVVVVKIISRSTAACVCMRTNLERQNIENKTVEKAEECYFEIHIKTHSGESH